MWTALLNELQQGNMKSLARSISLIENEVPGYEVFLQSLPVTHTPVIGITGPPGAGKSTLTDSLIGLLVNKGKKVAVLCVDPSSPFNLGALLGDRIRMSNWYNHPNVFIRSLATRGSLGGLHPKILEITDTCKAAGFDYVIVETVGVGQSEIEIAGLADVTTVVLVPEAGDEVQTMKAGLMEIADIFAVNKADRPEADLFVRNLRLMLAPAFTTHEQEIHVVKTIATEQNGAAELLEKIELLLQHQHSNERRSWLLAEKAYYLIQQQRMKDVQKKAMKLQIEEEMKKSDFNLYKFIHNYLLL
ncbi:methylmalonyl Co-A mutase-associated GTPase MeaB [Lacibacter luteus]|uniref:Methylmalonyl Co-A mutase-associated GTPase MeaB n=1 Tax=Lacibacter luteus TaxID=2508719 RepID=A0A4V1M7R3_9BACT|nr:methylmalonyl Co-A mutase-associated GTPase MeaB [Lacibacter luteus]RXK60975.1 methylmalonyl Co-A mutase-associated GTPase MeaB [Lacibacter luteus]